MKQSRTHNCGELRLSDAGKAVTIVGWMENVREVGSNFAFVVLRGPLVGIATPVCALARNDNRCSLRIDKLRFPYHQKLHK